MNRMTAKRRIFWFIVMLLIGIPVYLYMHANMLKTKPYQLSETFLSNNGKVLEKLGMPVRFSVSFFTGYDVHRYANSEEKAKLRINVVGEKNKGTAVIELETQKSKWLITSATLIMENGEEINLMRNGNTP